MKSFFRIITLFSLTIFLILITYFFLPNNTPVIDTHNIKQNMIKENKQSTTTEAIYRLRPVDTSSPRALISSLEDELHYLMILYQEGRQSFPKIRRHVKRMVQIFNFSETPPALVPQKGREHLWQLIDIIGRLPKLEKQNIPNAKQVFEQKIDTWTIPHTELTLQRVEEGQRKGEFLISPHTFKRIPEFYEKLIDLPKRSDAIVPLESYLMYRNGAGTSFSPHIINKLPEFLRQDFLGQAIWRLLILLAILGLMFVLAGIFFNLRPNDEENDTPIEKSDLDLGDTLRRLALPIYLLIMVQFLDYMSIKELRLTGIVLASCQIFIKLMTLIGIAYLLHLFFFLMAEVVIKVLNTRNASFDSQLVRLTGRILFWVTAFMVIAIILEEIGVPVAALAAGLGVSGLDFALASQSTLENLIAGLTLYSDRPIRIGDDCTIGDISGEVESIGLRSTRLRTDDRSLIVIPNAEIAKHTLENISLCDFMLFDKTIHLSHETDKDQLHYILSHLRNLAQEHTQVIDFDTRIHFIGFGDSSVDIGIFLYVDAVEDLEYLDICENLNFHIMTIIQEAGTSIAITAQTIYLAQNKISELNTNNTVQAKIQTQ